jgi:hypothetical protein
MLINKVLAKKILYNGKLYCPANLHYPEKSNPIVKCDYCGKSSLYISIGYDDIQHKKKFDICLNCSYKLELDSCVEDKTELLMMQDSVSFIDEDDDIATFMMQDSVRSSF